MGLSMSISFPEKTVWEKSKGIDPDRRANCTPVPLFSKVQYGKPDLKKLKLAVSYRKPVPLFLNMQFSTPIMPPSAASAPVSQPEKVQPKIMAEAEEERPVPPLPTKSRSHSVTREGLSVRMDRVPVKQLRPLPSVQP